jgi:hypothetical protein
MRSTRNVERNAAAAEAGPLGRHEMVKLRSHRWVKNFYA